MKLPDELSALSRHLMLFLIAIFAFASKTLLESEINWVRLFYAASLLIGVASFVAGYSTLFSIFNQELTHPSASEASAKATPLVIRRAKLQYGLTIFSLALLVIALLIQLAWR